VLGKGVKKGMDKMTEAKRVGDIRISKGRKRLGMRPMRPARSGNRFIHRASVAVRDWVLTCVNEMRQTEMKRECEDLMNRAREERSSKEDELGGFIERLREMDSKINEGQN
jgi:hypothetical protein